MFILHQVHTQLEVVMLQHQLPMSDRVAHPGVNSLHRQFPTSVGASGPFARRSLHSKVRKQNNLPHPQVLSSEQQIKLGVCGCVRDCLPSRHADHKAETVALKGNDGDVWKENFTGRPFPKGLS